MSAQLGEFAKKMDLRTLQQQLLAQMDKSVFQVLEPGKSFLALQDTIVPHKRLKCLSMQIDVNVDSSVSSVQVKQPRREIIVRRPITVHQEQEC